MLPILYHGGQGRTYVQPWGDHGPSKKKLNSYKIYFIYIFYPYWTLQNFKLIPPKDKAIFLKMLPIIYIYIPVGWKDFFLHRGGALVGAASCFLVKASGFWSSGLPALFYGDVEEEDDGRWVIFSKNVKSMWLWC
jgi:hypothetical protein